MECIPVHHPERAGACAIVVPDVDATHVCAEGVEDHGGEHRCRCGLTWPAPSLAER